MDVVKFPCSHCQHLIAVGAELAGRAVRCPHCQQVVTAPGGESAAGSNPFSFGGGEPVAPAAADDAPLAYEERPGLQEDDAPAPVRINQPPAAGGRNNWFLAILAPYAVLMTIMAITYFVKYQRAVTTHPLEQIPDLLGEFQQKQTKGTQARKLPQPDQDLPAKLTTTLGQPLRIGAIELTPLSVEYRPWTAYTKAKNRSEPTKKPVGKTLVLHVRLTNVSSDLTFYPTDPYFDRNPKVPTDKPYTLVDVGGKKYFGGVIVFVTDDNRTERTWLQGQEAEDKPLAPGESRETVFVTRPSDKVYSAVQKANAAVWRVQVRRGLVPYRDTEVPVSAVVGVAFTAADVKTAG